MKKLTYQYPKSSFLSLEKDMGIIIDFFLKNERLKKLLYWTTPDCLFRENLSEEQMLELFDLGYIRMVPKFKVDRDVLNYIVIRFNNFTRNMTNTEFRNNVIYFDIICHFDQWQMNDFQLRPFKIAAEIDSMLNGKHLSGIGELEFLGCNHTLVNDEFAGLTLMYTAIHGEDDKINSPNLKDQEDIDFNFNQIFNIEE